MGATVTDAQLTALLGLLTALGTGIGYIIRSALERAGKREEARIATEAARDAAKVIADAAATERLAGAMTGMSMAVMESVKSQTRMEMQVGELVRRFPDVEKQIGAVAIFVDEITGQHEIPLSELLPERRTPARGVTSSEYGFGGKRRP